MRLLRTGVLSVVMIGLGAVAAAAAMNGTYAGQNDQGYRVMLRVARTTVTQFRFKLRESCSNGSTAVRSHHLNPGVSIPVRDGQFDRTFKGTSSSGSYSIRYRIRLTGLLYRGRVSGSMREREDYYRGRSHVATCGSRLLSYSGDRT